MQFISRLVLLALGFLPLSFGQLNSIGLLASSSMHQSLSLSTSSVLTISSTSSLPTSTSLTSGSTPSITPTPIPSITEAGDELILNTIFTQPSGCDTGITAVPSWTSQLWQNIINPVPTLTLTSCYPSQFYYSAVATGPLPPFTQLVCPKNWETYNVTESYIICCPRGYSLYAPNYHNTDRPGLDAVCTSSIWPDVLMDITSYDATALATVIDTTADINGTLVFATAYDGTLAGFVASVASTALSIASKTVDSSAPVTTTAFRTVASSTSTTTSSSAASLQLLYSQPLRLLQLLLLLVIV
ncbi:hypothetical protein TMatcc_008518 [Talaromyces marneffei ATCC 18224]|uniref:CFEM domain protein n=1 Tax=Talaromyces marneffei (strain ATCC 18224 / CBS 334.59 / QM 7333) TaxID=441960 RepID=B6QLT1_TALMQ|nr:uncharacterized protein EYB26_007850 [Talaromyces marneffei]EEA22058.1 hypothetical protein PMAA_058380 [Talaromyces marneffei ATCC 18224]KAE8550481.1 hypothetical protein EYB25_006708 [Talaromyces marneffei]QGA20149.1 hypothetical protein EYB26_007850 [Talaromyces marneffei]